MSSRQSRRMTPLMRSTAVNPRWSKSSQSVALQREAVVVGIGEAAAAFDDVELRGRVHAERRVLAPFPGTLACAGSMPSAPSAAATRSASLAAKLQTSSRGHLPAALSGRASVPATPVPRAVQDHLVAARANLHAQRAVAFEARGQSAVQRQRREAVRQHARQQLFAASPATFRRMRVIDRRGCRRAPGDRPALPWRRPARAAALAEPHAAVRAFGLRDALAVDEQVDDCGGVGKRQRLRTRAHSICPRSCAAGARAARDVVARDDGAGAPLTRTSCGQCSMLPGDATQLSAYTCQRCENVPPRASSSMVRRSGHAQR